MTIFSNEAERVHWFVRVLTLSVRSSMFRAPMDGDYFQSSLSTAKEVDLMVL